MVKFGFKNFGVCITGMVGLFSNIHLLEWCICCELYVVCWFCVGVRLDSYFIAKVSGTQTLTLTPRQSAQTLTLTPNKHLSTGFHVQLMPDKHQLAGLNCKYLNIKLMQLMPKVA